MKKHTKWLALLLAGLITCSIFSACDNQTPSNNGDNEDKEPNETVSPSKILTPNEIEDELYETEKFTIGFETKRQSSAESYSINRIYMKNGDIIKASETTISEGYNSKNEVYVDLKNQMQYSFRNEKWSATSAQVSLEELYKDVLFSELLLSNDSYDEYDGQNDCTPLKEDTLRSYFNLDETVEISGYMKVQNSIYTFFMVSGDSSYTITIEFAAEKLTLPEVSDSSVN